MSELYYTQDGLSEIKGKPKNVIIKIDSNLVSTHRVINKNLSLSQAKKSIPFNLEGELLDDIDNLEFFIKKNGEIFDIITIKKQILIDLKTIIKEKKLHIIGAYATFMFLPLEKDKVSYVQYDEDITFRTDKYQGGKLNKELFFAKFDNEEIQEVENRSFDYKLINFLQYDISEIYTKLIKPWFGLIAIILFILILKTALLTMQNYKNEGLLNNLQQNNEKLFKSMFPDITRVVDIKVQTKQKMANLTTQKQLSQYDFLTALLQKDLTSTSLKSITFDKKLEVK